MIYTFVLFPGNLKGGIGSLFDPCVNATAILTVMYGGELCSSGFGAIIWRDLRTSLSRDSLRDNFFCMRDLSPHRKGNSCLTKFPGGLSYKKNPEIK